MPNVIVLSQAGDIGIDLSVDTPQVPIERMFNLTQVALTISPLLLLCSKWGISDSINRHILLEVNFHLSFES